MASGQGKPSASGRDVPGRPRARVVPRSPIRAERSTWAQPLPAPPLTKLCSWHRSDGLDRCCVRHHALTCGRAGRRRPIPRGSRIRDRRELGCGAPPLVRCSPLARGDSAPLPSYDQLPSEQTTKRRSLSAPPQRSRPRRKWSWQRSPAARPALELPAHRPRIAPKDEPLSTRRKPKSRARHAGLA